MDKCSKKSIWSAGNNNFNGDSKSNYLNNSSQSNNEYYGSYTTPIGDWTRGKNGNKQCDNNLISKTKSSLGPLEIFGNHVKGSNSFISKLLETNSYLNNFHSATKRSRFGAQNGLNYQKMTCKSNSCTQNNGNIISKSFGELQEIKLYRTPERVKKYSYEPSCKSKSKCQSESTAELDSKSMANYTRFTGGQNNFNGGGSCCPRPACPPPCPPPYPFCQPPIILPRRNQSSSSCCSDGNHEPTCKSKKKSPTCNKPKENQYFPVFCKKPCGSKGHNVFVKKNKCKANKKKTMCKHNSKPRCC